MNHRLSRFLGAVIFCLIGSISFAKDVTLTSKSGGLTVSGELLSYDGKTYQVQTDLGRITVVDKNLTCNGSGCPSPKDRLNRFSLVPSERIDRETLVAILKSFAKDNKKIYDQSGPFSKPDLVELSHRTQGLETQITFKTDVTNLKFNADDGDTTIGFDAVQIISNAQALNGKISAQTLRGIWDGSISNWSELGGPDAKIRLILPIFADDLYRTITRFDPEISAENITESVEFFLSRDAIIQAIDEMDDAIGLIYKTSPMDASLAIETSCGIVNAPSSFAIQSMEYPLAFRINISSNQSQLPSAAQGFKTYTTTPPAQELLSQAGVVPLVGTTIDARYQGKRFADAISNADRDTTLSQLKAFTSFATNATRLATTFYMAPNGRDLDASSARLVSPLATLLKTDAYANRKIIAVGFSDSSGPANGNLTVSKRRAAIVQSALSKFDVAVETSAFGELAPIGCNSTDFGTKQNRRVEIWVVD